MKHEKIKITKNMRKAELYESCMELLEANFNLSILIEQLEKRLAINMSDSLALSRSLYFILHHFEPKEALVELDCEGESDIDGDIPIKKSKSELLDGYQ